MILGGVIAFVGTHAYDNIALRRLQVEHLTYMQRSEANVRNLKLEIDQWSAALYAASDDLLHQQAEHSAELRAATAGAGGLRNDLSRLRAEYARIAARDKANAALADTAATIAELYSECTGAYLEMAGVAQGHADDVRRFTRGNS
jgi:hypothetical protein